MTKGDIVLVAFPFTDLSGSKVRPAFVLHETAADVTLIFISSRVLIANKNDVILNPNSSNGLKVSSVIKLNKIICLDKKFVLGKLGSLSRAEIFSVNKNLILLFQLDKIKIKSKAKDLPLLAKTKTKTKAVLPNCSRAMPG